VAEHGSPDAQGRATGSTAQASSKDAPRVVVAGATGFAGALAAHLLWRHPRFQLTAVTGRSEVGRRLDDLYPRYRVPMEIEQLDLDKLGRIDAAVVAYPHAAAAPTVG
jgi:N-acetyl-gamma-glutamyl-phosphate reductase